MCESELLLIDDHIGLLMVRGLTVANAGVSIDSWLLSCNAVLVLVHVCISNVFVGL